MYNINREECPIRIGLKIKRDIGNKLLNPLFHPILSIKVVPHRCWISMKSDRNQKFPEINRISNLKIFTPVLRLICEINFVLFYEWSLSFENRIQVGLKFRCAIWNTRPSQSFYSVSGRSDRVVFSHWAFMADQGSSKFLTSRLFALEYFLARY